MTTSTRLLLRGGLVADGIGDVVRRADVLVDGAVIGWIRDRGSEGEPGPDGDWEVVDLEPGSTVCPGFIDAHVHAEGPLLESGVVEGALAQGVTTLVVGQDGESWIGATAETARYLNRYFGPVNGALEPVRDLSVAGYREAVAGRLVQNVAVLASQGTIRHNVVGLSPGLMGVAEVAEARRQVEAALSDGAVGLSSGLDYVPSRFGTVGEIAAMCAPLVGAGRPYVSHTRGNGPTAPAALAELVAVGERAGVRVHASHLWGAPRELEVAFGAADVAGVGLTFDMYPYRKSSTILAVLLLPGEVQAEGPDGTIAALGDPRRRPEILADEKLSDEFLEDIYLGCLPAEFGRFAGVSVARAAASEGSRSAGEWVLDLLVGAGLNVGAHLDRPTLTQGDLDWLAGHDRHCVGSDGIYQGQHPHPRGNGAFARLAEHYLAVGRDAGAQRLARHLATNAADVYGLSDRGRLAAGLAADICVMAPGEIGDRATYGEPQMKAIGVNLVIVNGVIAWCHGEVCADRIPGQIVS